MEEHFENILNDDLKRKIYSIITYPQSHELLTQIKLYQDKKIYITLFYNYIINSWTYCYIDALNIIWKIYYICIISKGDILWKDKEHLNYCLINYKKYISEENEKIYVAEIIRILNNENNKIKHILLKKYIIKYIMVLKKHHIDFLKEELSIWGNITSYGYVDESLNDFSKETIENAYKISPPVINNNDIINLSLLDN